MSRGRTDRRMAAIAGFREELERLEAMGLVGLDAETKKGIRAYHEEVLEDLAGDSGATDGGRPAPFGMRIAGTAGALVLAALLLVSLDLIWPALPTWLRIAVALALPLALLALAEALFAAGYSGYAVAFAAGLSAAAFLLACKILTALAGLPLGFEPLLFAGVYTAALGHRYRSRELAVPGLAAAAGALAAVAAQADGSLWPALLYRLEPFILAGFLLFAAGSLIGRIAPAMRPAWRLAGLLLAGTALIMIGETGESLLPLPQALRQAMAASLLLVALAAGILLDWRETGRGALLLLFALALVRLDALLEGRVPDSLALVAALALATGFAWLFHLLRRLEARRGRSEG